MFININLTMDYELISIICIYDRFSKILNCIFRYISLKIIKTKRLNNNNQKWQIELRNIFQVVAIFIDMHCKFRIHPDLINFAPSETQKLST